ncbi:hypothetical protein GH714_041049 [Hevea brasiliensis]|uniref:Hexosyltransferase n=1 Tax=Hevea brasiliensis TaxID=3981 RepID=A0A6A6N9F4_HEVBR|nr:hypothetical protein GH714_041049 [Hevea brasiliensis]
MPPKFRPRFFIILLLATAATISVHSLSNALNFERLPLFREAPAFRNGRECPQVTWSSIINGQSRHDPSSIIHIAMTLDSTYPPVAPLPASYPYCSSMPLAPRTSSSTHRHAPRAELRRAELRRTVTVTFPYLNFHLYHFDADLVKGKISSSIRRALDQPLNYARFYLADLLPASVSRIIYFDSDLIVVDDVAKLWNINLGAHVLGAPEYCQANFTNYFNSRFWSNPACAASFRGSKPCYFNTGVMVIDLVKWRDGKYTQKLEYWMRIQKKYRIYELGSLPPFLLVFAGNVEGVEHRWNQHGLGGDNLHGLCRDLHPGPASLLHWSGKGKPWLRIDSKRPCPLDSLWAPYDLYRHSLLFSDS